MLDELEQWINAEYEFINTAENQDKADGVASHSDRIYWEGRRMTLHNLKKKLDTVGEYTNA